MESSTSYLPTLAQNKSYTYSTNRSKRSLQDEQRQDRKVYKTTDHDTLDNIEHEKRQKKVITYKEYLQRKGTSSVKAVNLTEQTAKSNTNTSIPAKSGKPVIISHTTKDTGTGSNISRKRKHESASPTEQPVAKKLSRPDNNKDASSRKLRVSPLSRMFIPPVTKKSIQFQRDTHGRLQVLGSGGYGWVVPGELREVHVGRRHRIVGKFFRKEKTSVDGILHESRMLAYLKDTGAVPRLHGLLQSEDPTKTPVIIQERIGDGHHLYHSLKTGGREKSTWINTCMEATQHLLNIHHKGVLLNDIKMDNMMMDREGKIRFIDLGMASIDSGITLTRGQSLSKCQHIAPEVKDGQPTSVKSDIFSLGQVFKKMGEETGEHRLQNISRLMGHPEPTRRVALPTVISLLKSLR